MLLRSLTDGMQLVININKNMIKVYYNSETTLVQGYYPDSIKYNYKIPTPNIIIKDNEQVLDKQMCVVNGAYQEYVKPLEIQLQEGKEAKIKKCLAYLAKTDWYAVRLAETQVEIPANILENRTSARNLQEEIKACKTLEELNNININFS